MHCQTPPTIGLIDLLTEPLRKAPHTIAPGSTHPIGRLDRPLFRVLIARAKQPNFPVNSMRYEAASGAGNHGLKGDQGRSLRF
jgi:hypothetical protein